MPPAPGKEEIPAAPWGPELAQKATRSMAALHGGRALEVAVGRCLHLPGVDALDNLDMLGLRDSVRAELAQAPSRAVTGRTPDQVAREEVGRRATHKRLQVLTGGSEDLHRKLTGVMRAVVVTKDRLARELPALLGDGHPLQGVVAKMPPPRRIALLMPLIERCLREAHEALPLADSGLQEALQPFASGQFQAGCAERVKAFVEGLPPSRLGTGLATLYEQHGERFVTRYSQSQDPSLQHRGNDGVCLGLCLQWTHDGGRLHLEEPGSVGPNAARRVRIMQQSMEVSRQIVDVPGFRERAARVMGAVPGKEQVPSAAEAEGGTEPPLREQVGEMVRTQVQRVQTARFELNREMFQTARQGWSPTNDVKMRALAARRQYHDFMMPHRMVNQQRIDPVLVVQEPFTPLRPGAWFAGLQQATHRRVGFAAQRVHQGGRPTRLILSIKFEGSGHAVALSISPHSPTDRTPRLTFFDPNAGEATFRPRDPTKPVTSLGDFEHFEAFSEAWFEQMHDGRGLALQVRNTSV